MKGKRKKREKEVKIIYLTSAERVISVSATKGIPIEVVQLIPKEKPEPNLHKK